jgi:hypothetical protein
MLAYAKYSCLFFHSIKRSYHPYSICLLHVQITAILIAAFNYTTVLELKCVCALYTNLCSIHTIDLKRWEIFKWNRIDGRFEDHVSMSLKTRLIKQENYQSLLVTDIYILSIISSHFVQYHNFALLLLHYLKF